MQIASMVIVGAIKCPSNTEVVDAMVLISYHSLRRWRSIKQCALETGISGTVLIRLFTSYGTKGRVNSPNAAFDELALLTRMLAKNYRSRS